MTIVPSAEPRIGGHAAVGFLVCLLVCLECAADAITFKRTGIPLRDCTVQAIQRGQVHYMDNRGQRQSREIDQVQSLGFEGLTDLDHAEKAIADGDLGSGLPKMMLALQRAQNDMQRLWIHARLAGVHGGQGEYVQAAGHAAAAMALGDDPTWRGLEPACEVNQPSYAAAKEAMERLQGALRRVKSPELKTPLESMTKKVQPVCDRLAGEYTGPAIASGSTISGLTKQEILNLVLNAEGKAEPTPAPVQAAAPTAAASAPAIKPSTPPKTIAVNAADPDSPDSIDALLAQSKWTEALESCLRVEKNPGQRELGHFLHQYGMALLHKGRASDAAVMFTRCAVLMPHSPDAAQCLIETAMIYRDEYHRADTARRLLERAAESAVTNGQESTAMLARELLGAK